MRLGIFLTFFCGGCSDVTLGVTESRAFFLVAGVAEVLTKAETEAASIAVVVELVLTVSQLAGEVKESMNGQWGLTALCT